MATIKVDQENNAEIWWDAARELAAKVSNPTFARVMNAIDRNEETFTAGDVEAFVAVASTLPGWDDGPRRARNPVVFDLEDDFGTLCDYATGETIRSATHEEREASVAAAKRDGGAGVFTVDGRRCYVQD